MHARQNELNPLLAKCPIPAFAVSFPKNPRLGYKANRNSRHMPDWLWGDFNKNFLKNKNKWACFKEGAAEDAQSIQVPSEPGRPAPEYQESPTPHTALGTLTKPAGTVPILRSLRSKMGLSPSLRRFCSSS